MINKRIDVIQTPNHLTNTELHLAEWINENTHLFINNKINEIARLSGVSLSTITRLSHVLGYGSFKNMQIEIAKKYALINENYELSQEDSIEAIINNIRVYNQFSVNETLNAIDPNHLKNLVDDIYKANRIMLYGIGSSYIACTELANNLQKVGFHVINNRDFHLQLLAYADFEAAKQDMIIVISKSAETKEIIHLIDLALKDKINITLITSNEQFKHKDELNHFITFKTHEQTERISAISSKFSELLVVDTIYVEVFRRNYAQFIKKINRGNQLVKSWNSTLNNKAKR